MNINKNNAGEHKTSLRNYSQVNSHGRLANRDEHLSSSITAGGEDEYLAKDMEGDVTVVQETDRR